MPKTVVNLPEGIECAVTYFLTSDTADIDCKVTIGALPIEPILKDVSDFDGTALLAAIGASGHTDLGPLLIAADDWRLMTRAEVATYKAENP